MQGIGRRKRNRPFRDKTKSHNKVRHTGRTFLLSKFLFEQQRAESDGNGGTIPPIITEAMMPEETAWPEAPAREAVPNT